MLLLAHDVPLPFMRGHTNRFFNLANCPLGEFALFVSQQGICDQRCPPALSSVCRTVTANTGQIELRKYQSDQLVNTLQLLKAPKLAHFPFQSQLGSPFSEAELSKLA